jgi:hypothetical protein
VRDGVRSENGLQTPPIEEAAMSPGEVGEKEPQTPSIAEVEARPSLSCDAAVFATEALLYEEAWALPELHTGLST